MNRKNNLKKIIFTALLAALTCAATISIRIPVPGTQGYIHPGDALVILSGILLGPLYGFLAGAAGSCMADLAGGYLLYLPATFIIKGAVAFLCGFLPRTFSSDTGRRWTPAAGGIIDILFITGGYFLYETFLYGWQTAFLAVGPNLLQSAGGLIIAVILYPAVQKISSGMFLHLS